MLSPAFQPASAGQPSSSSLANAPFPHPAIHIDDRFEIVMTYLRV